MSGKLFQRRRENGLLNYPTIVQSPCCASDWNRKFSANRSYASGKTIQCKNPTGSPVSVLFFICRPSHVQIPSFMNAFGAIAASIRSIIVYAINLHAFWSFTEKIKKIWKRLKTFTYHNASASPICKTNIFWIQAPIAHSGPRDVCSCFGHSMGRASDSRHFIAETAARFSMSSKKIAIERNKLISALAPKSAFKFSVLREFLKYDSPSKSLSDKRFSSRHNGSSSIVVLVAGVQHQLALAATLPRTV